MNAQHVTTYTNCVCVCRQTENLVVFMHDAVSKMLVIGFESVNEIVVHELNTELFGRLVVDEVEV